MATERKENGARLTIGAKDIAVHSSLIIREVVCFFVTASRAHCVVKFASWG
jgi:hypothetical protein